MRPIQFVDRKRPTVFFVAISVTSSSSTKTLFTERCTHRGFTLRQWSTNMYVLQNQNAYLHGTCANNYISWESSWTIGKTTETILVFVWGRVQEMLATTWSWLIRKINENYTVLVHTYSWQRHNCDINVQHQKFDFIARCQTSGISYIFGLYHQPIWHYDVLLSPGKRADGQNFDRCSLPRS